MWYETLPSMLSAEKEQIKVLQNKTNVSWILNIFLSCQKYQGQDNATAPYNGGCFNPFLVNKTRLFAGYPTALTFGESTGVPWVEATSNEGCNIAKQRQVPPLQSGICWGYITPVLNLPAVGNPFSVEIMGIWRHQDGLESGFVVPRRHKPKIYRDIPCSPQTQLPDMLGAHVGWESLGGFVTHPCISI